MFGLPMYRLPRLRLLLFALLAIGIAAFAGCGSDSKNPTSPGGGGGGGGTADVTISIVANNGANSYSPASAVCTVGQKVAWKNNDGMTHTATSNPGGAFNTGNIAPGATSAPITMNTAGTFNYQCSIHPTMTGVLTVNP